MAPLPTDGGGVRGRPPRGHGGQRADTPTTPTPSSPPATGMDETADIAEEWLEEEAEMSPWSPKARVRISLLPTGARSPPSARPRRLGGATWTRMMTWTSATRRSPRPRTHRGDPAKAHRDPLAEDHQDPLEDAHQVDPPEADLRAGEDPLDRADPAEALLEDHLGAPDSPPEDSDPEATWRWIVHLRRRVQTLQREVDTGKGEMICIARVAAGAQKALDTAETEMVKIAKLATAAQRELDIARGETRLLNKVINGLQQRLDELEAVGASAATTHPWSPARRTTAGDLDQVQAEPTPPAEPPGVAPAPVPPLPASPLITARAAVTSVCRPAVAVRIGVTSGSVRSTTTAVLHRGHQYAPDAPHQPRSQFQWLAGVMVDSEMRSPEGTWSGMSAEARKT